VIPNLKAATGGQLGPAWGGNNGAVSYITLDCIAKPERWYSVGKAWGILGRMGLRGAERCRLYRRD